MRGSYHWCNDHAEHVTGPGVTTTRASRQLANAVINANGAFLEKLEKLVAAQVVTPWEAKMALLELGQSS